MILPVEIGSEFNRECYTYVIVLTFRKLSGDGNGEKYVNNAD